VYGGERAECETTPLPGSIGEALAASGYIIASCNVGASRVWDSSMTVTSTKEPAIDTYGYHFQWGNNFGFDARPIANAPAPNSGTELVNTEGYGPNNYYSRDIFVKVTSTGSVDLSYDWSYSGDYKTRNNNLRGDVTNTS
jgi:hypothetical protein